MEANNSLIYTLFDYDEDGIDDDAFVALCNDDFDTAILIFYASAEKSPYARYRPS